MGEKFIIDLDKSIYSLVNKDLNTVSGELGSVKGYKILITDFNATSFAGVMNVDANIKYAEAMVARKLQDDGDFDEPVTVITHWKMKTGKNSTEIFFTAVTSRIYLQYLDKIKQHETLLILLPVFAVLVDFAGQIPHKNPIAVVFRHNRFADIVISGKTRFYHTARCVAFDTSDEQISELWKTVEQEIATVSEDKSIQIEKLIALNWIGTKQNEPFFDCFKIDCFVFNEEPVFADGSEYNISFTNALEKISPLNGIAPNNGKLFYFADKMCASIIAVFIILICAMSYGYFSYHLKAEKLEKKISSAQREIHMMRDIAVSSVPRKQDYLRTAKFVDSIFYIKHLPSLHKIINDISSAMYPSTIIDDLKISYTGRTMQAIMTGVINTGFNTAYKDYEGLCSNLRTDGYSIDKNNFNTDIQHSEFKLVFSWSMR